MNPKADRVYKVKPRGYRACLFVIAADLDDALDVVEKYTYLSRDIGELIAKEVATLNRWHEPQMVTTSSIRDIVHVVDKHGKVIFNFNKIRKVLAGEYADMFEVDIKELSFNGNSRYRHEVLDTELNTIKINQEVIFDD